LTTAALPFLRRITPTRFGWLLALGEIATGGVLLTPLVPARWAGGL
jgi:hypothetical protein